MTNETPGGATGTMDPVEIEYLAFDTEGSPVSIRMNPGVMEGIAHDVAEGAGAEAGGLLLGRVEGGARPSVWIDRYQRIDCKRAEFILDSGEISALETAANKVLAAGEVAVVGLYRSHTRPGYQLEQPDFDLIRRYFSDPSDLILLIRPNGEGGMSAQFLVWDEAQGARPAGSEFPFRLKEGKEAAQPAATTPALPREVPRERPRRLVPDFAPAPVEPAPSVFGLSAAPEWVRPDELTVEDRAGERLRKWFPLAAALVLVGGVLWFVLRPEGHGAANPTPAQTVEAARPLGLYVDPTGQTWSVSWNPNATALRGARNVRLFVHEKNEPGADDASGDDQNPIDLSARELASGSYQYRPTGNDVMFRLEVTDQAGRVSAESFRIVRTASPSAAAPTAPKPVPPVSGLPAARMVQPRATYRAPAVVAAGIRSRIKGSVPIDVRVHIDERGRVVSAAPVSRATFGDR